VSSLAGRSLRLLAAALPSSTSRFFSSGRIECLLMHVPDELLASLPVFGTLIGTLDRDDNIIGEILAIASARGEGIQVLLSRRLSQPPVSSQSCDTPVRTPIRAGRRAEMILVRTAGIGRGALSFETRGRVDDGEGGAKRRRGRACGFSSPVAPGTWAGTSSAS
jgi:hypothetical protein